MKLAEAYQECRKIARREAKNFYYAFRVLPQEKSDAMCAVYAFMRMADDISDDESMPVTERRKKMAEWLQAWRSKDQNDGVFVALRDAQHKFGIEDQLLEQLVEGTTMDLEQSPGEQSVQTYADFSELYHYCYLVASVVGLVCIRIFGYRDPRAEKLAEETGVAFQLTNILRDIKEDIGRDRVYVPLDLMTEFGASVEGLRELSAGRPLRQEERDMLRALANRAEGYYSSAQELLPLIHEDSRPALWVLVKIYHALLRKIEERDGDVFSQRVSVSGAQKCWILAQGAKQGLRNKLWKAA